MTTRSQAQFAPPRPRVSIDAPPSSSRGSVVPADASRAGLTDAERAELLRLRAEKLELQTRINELNLQLTLVKAAAALFVGERGRPGHGSIAAPEVA